VISEEEEEKKLVTAEYYTHNHSWAKAIQLLS